MLFIELSTWICSERIQRMKLQSIKTPVGMSIIALSMSCGQSNEPAKITLSQTQGVSDVAILSPILFAEKYTIPYKNMSPSQLDTLCIDLSGKNIATLQSNIDLHAHEVGLEKPEVIFWYNQYQKNEYDYNQWCATSGFPKTFISTRTGQAHTVNNITQCKNVTSDAVATEYVNYVRDGGSPIMIAAKIKTTGCANSSNPFKSLIQSVHGSMIDGFRGIPQSYP